MATSGATLQWERVAYPSTIPTRRELENPSSLVVDVEQTAKALLRGLDSRPSTARGVFLRFERSVTESYAASKWVATRRKHPLPLSGNRPTEAEMAIAAGRLDLSATFVATLFSGHVLIMDRHTYLHDFNERQRIGYKSTTGTIITDLSSMLLLSDMGLNTIYPRPETRPTCEMLSRALAQRHPSTYIRQKPITIHRYLQTLDRLGIFNEMAKTSREFAKRFVEEPGIINENSFKELNSMVGSGMMHRPKSRAEVWAEITDGRASRALVRRVTL